MTGPARYRLKPPSGGDTPGGGGSTPGLEYRFDIAPGKVNYVGDLNFSPPDSLESRLRALNLGSAYAEPITGTGATTFNIVASPGLLDLRSQVLDQQVRDVPRFDMQFPAYKQKEMLWCVGCELRNP